jgi:hypothetical protein
LLSRSGHGVVEQDLLRCLGVPGWRPPDSLGVPREVALSGESNAGSHLEIRVLVHHGSAVHFSRFHEH